MTIWNSAVHASLLAGTALLAFPGTALADEAADEAATGDAITVVGQRQQYRGDVPLREIPQSVQEINGEMLKDLNITRLDTALDLASGIARQNNFGGLWDAFAVRGFAGDENFPSGFLVNGFNGGRGYGGPRDASNIERIEILKGPNGAVFGRGEPGGTVNIITRKATLDNTFGSFSASAGSFDTYRVEGDYNLALSDKLAVRLNGAAQDAGSFRDTIESNKIVASPSVLFQPTSSTSLSYEMEYVDQEVPFDRGVVAIDGVLGRIPRSTFLGEPGDGPIKVKVLGHQVQLQQELAKDWVFLAGFGYRDTSFGGYSTEAELSGGRQTLEETGNYLSRQRRFRDYDTTNMVFRGEVSGKLYTGPFTHHVLVGADWDRFEINLLQQRFRPGSYTAGSAITASNNAIDIFDPVYGQMPTPNVTITNSKEVQKSWGIYFQDQIDITDHFKIRVGGRYDHFRQNVDNHLATVNPITINVRKRFSPTAGALYELTDTLSIYAGYGTGFRPNSGLDADGNTFSPETSKSYEAGLRFVSPDNAISATLAAFTMKKNNILTMNPNNANFSIAAGSARSKGIEADVNARLPGGFNVIGTYAYTDAYWTTASQDMSFGLTILPGDSLINIPKHAANLLVTKEFDLGDAGVVTIGSGVNYVGKRLGETGVDFHLPDYTLVRAMASYAPSESVKLSLDATNLFNVTYYPASYHRYWVTPGTPRAVTFRVDFSF
ncbi:iron complex outermembrane recepter protein [Novosphingobium sp. CF614]|uniref:TonB-dependent siderophore receptor n=1 Tax=Novosphingobium sp. CF614 TaxID=1884364 RepID=UPI0008DF83C4|nr:TonB-dependent receptor [Novosphingobium sp. CF614]SFG11275.1 iron complex outermembrane recepter protein [Novosphingobium sp. CF614]